MDTASDAVEIANGDNQSTIENSTNSRQSSTDRNVNSLSEIVDNNESNEKDLANAQSQDTVNSSNTDSNDTIAEQSKESEKPTVSSGAETAAATTGQIAQDEYAQYITYDGSGVAIYTDPSTNCRYEFDKESNQWVPIKTESSGNQDGTPASGDDVYENEHYRWCHTTNEWVLKEPSSEAVASAAPQSTSSSSASTAAATATENEFYKWDAEKEQWIPKTTGQGFVSESKDGLHTYTDHDGVVFFWDTEKNAWFPKIDDDFMAVYQMNYGFIDNTSPSTKNTASQNAGDIPMAKASGVCDVCDVSDDEKSAAAGGKRKPEAPSNYKLIIVVVRSKLQQFPTDFSFTFL